jgi:hypothetical protein
MKYTIIIILSLIVLFSCSQPNTKSMEQIKNLERTEYNSFEGTTTIEEWKDFAFDFKPTDQFDITFLVDNDSAIISQAQKNTFNSVINNQDSIKNILLNRLMVEYGEIQSIYGDGLKNPKEKDLYTPDINSIEDFKNLIDLGGIFIFSEEKDGECYTGYSFRCKWDIEHGLGFKVHKNQVLEFGGADEAF